MTAASRPPGLVGLVLCATFVTGPIRLLGPVIRILARAPLFRFAPFFQRLKAKFGGYSSPKFRELLAEIHKDMRPEVLAARARMVFETDARPALIACEVPMLYIAGLRDRVVPKHNFRVIQRLAPDIQRAELDAPHLILQTRPTEAFEAIMRFGLTLATGSP
jgi:pimeloyl-ACP methyl ester carboxylesterase